MGGHSAAVEKHADAQMGTNKSGMYGAASPAGASFTLKLWMADLLIIAGKSANCKPHYCC